MNRWLVGAILVLVVVAVFLAGLDRLAGDRVSTRAKAIEYAKSELSYRYPGAEIEVYDVSNTSDTEGQSSWLVKSKVVYGENTLCPNLTIVEMDEKFSFVPRERVITEQCSVLGCRGIPYCLIAYPEEAILMPFDEQRNPSLQEPLLAYISGADISSFQAVARQASQIVSQTNHTYYDVWVVDYYSPELPSGFEVILNRTGGKEIEHYYTSG
jgi:hypothetical protein